MKHLFASLFVVATLAICACQQKQIQSSEKLILGTWRLYAKTGDRITYSFFSDGNIRIVTADKLGEFKYKVKDDKYLNIYDEELTSNMMFEIDNKKLADGVLELKDVDNLGQSWLVMFREDDPVWSALDNPQGK